MRPRWRAPLVGDTDEGWPTSCGVEWIGGGERALGEHGRRGGRGFIFSSLISCVRGTLRMQPRLRG